MSTSAIDLSAGLEPVSQSGDGGIDLSAGLEGVSTGPVNPYAHEAPTPPQEITDPLGLKNKPVWDQSTLPSPAAGMRQGGNAAEQEFNAQDKTPSRLGWMPKVRPAPRNAAEQVQQTTQAPLVPVPVSGKTNFSLPQPGVQHTDLDQLSQEKDQRVQAFLKANPLAVNSAALIDAAMKSGTIPDRELAEFKKYGVNWSEVKDYIQQNGAAAYHPAQAVKQIGQGLTNIGESYEQRQEAQELMAARPELTNAEANQAIAWKYGKTPISRLAQGGTEAMSGAMGLGTPAIAAGVAEAPFKAALEYGAGVLAGKGVAEAAKAAGASPEVQEAANVAGFFIPSFMTGAAGLRSGGFPEGATVRDPVTGKEVPVRGGVVGGKGFAAGVARSDTGEYSAQARVGPYSFKAKWGRNVPGEPEAPGTPQISGPEQPPPTASEIQQNAQQTTVDETAARAAQIQEKAAQIAGLAPPPPPPPKPGEPGSGKLPSPAGMDQGNLTQQTVETVGKIIQSLPAQKRSGALLEAVGNLAKWMLGKKTFVGPDNKVVTVDSPKAAQSEAVNLVNAEVDRQAEQAKEQQENQQKALEERQKNAETAQQEREEALAPEQPKEGAPAAVEIPNTAAVQKARQVLEKAPDHATAQQLETMVRNTAAVTTQVRKALVQEEIQRRANRQEDLAQQDMKEQPIPEGQSREQLEAWFNHLKAGEEPYAHVPAKHEYKPSLDTGKQSAFTKTTVRNSPVAGFNGDYYHAKDIKSQEIREAAQSPNPQDALDALRAKWKGGAGPVEVKDEDLEPESPAEPEQPTQNLSTPQLEHAAKEGENHSSEGQNTPKTSESAEQRKSELETQPGLKDQSKAIKEGSRITFEDVSGKERNGTVRAVAPNGNPIVEPDDRTGKREQIPLKRVKADQTLPGPATEPKLARAEQRNELAEKYRKQGQSSVDAKARALREMPITKEEQEANDKWDKDDRDNAPEFTMVQNQKPKAEPIASQPEPEPEPPDEKPVTALINDIYSKLEDGKSLGNVTELNKLGEKYLGGSRTSGAWTPKDLFDAMEAGVNKYLLDIGKGLLEMPAQEALSHLRNLMARITSQGTRTEDQVKNQQFSTPPTESYVVARVANLKPSDVVLEPSAGNGGLAVWPKAIGAEVHVNEIADRRQQMLEAVGFNKPTAHDGELINALLDPGIKPTVILMNPPFSASTLKSYEAKNQSRYGYNHVEQALQRLAPGGRLVAILGGGRDGFRGGEGASLRIGESGKWFDKIAKQYNVRANIRVDGKEYAKYGTNYSTRIIVIDKDGPTPSKALEAGNTWDSVIEKDVDTLEDAYNALKPVEESRPTGEVSRNDNTDSISGRPAASGLVANPDAGIPSVRAGTGGSASVDGEVPAPVRSDEPGPLPATSGPDSGAEQLPVHRPGSETERDNEGKAAGGSGAGASDGDNKRQVAERGLDLEREEEKRQREEEDESSYTTYQPTIKGAKHPGSIVETKSMATVPMPPITYKPNLPESVVGKAPDYDNAKLSAVQLEAVAIAGMQNDILLPGGFRGSALIGDGTGVGKGREGAAILWDNWRKGRRRLVWMTKSKDLIMDAIRDLEGLGANDLAKSIKNLGKMDASTPIDHHGILFTTYALFRSGDKKGNTRAAQIDKWLRADDGGEGGYLLMDESHNLKNAVVSQGGEASQIGQTVKKFLEKMPPLRTVSLSATAATDVMNLGYLDRLGLWGPGTPFPNGFNQFAAEIAHGGMSAMEMIARELKAQGKYVSRTLTYRGVEYSELKHEITPDQKAIYASAAKAWRDVYNSVEHTIMNTTGGGSRQKAMAMSQFFSAQQRFFNLLLTSIKIPTAVKAAEAALARGESVAITLVNTNEAAQNREKDRVAADDSGEEPDYDFGPGKLISDLVEEHYPTQQYRDDVDSNGNPVKVPVVDAKGNPVQNPQAVEAKNKLLKELSQLKMPANPLDDIIELLGGPSKVAELTGRKQRYDSSTNRLVNRGGNGVSQDKVNKSEEAAFQSGKKRIAILSSAADTGISLHADKSAKNQQKRFVITLQVGWSADKQMQMNGRFNRSNQANAPEYALLKTDLGGESRFISSIARRMESLEALSKGQTKTNTGTEAMSKVNFETDQGRAAAVAFYNSLLQNRDVPGALDAKGEQLTGREILKQLRVLKSQSGGGETVPPADRANITRLLNRLLALDPDVQQPVYDYFYDIFDATVKRAEADGTLDTGVKRLPGDSFHIVEQRELSADPKTGAKTFYYPIESQIRKYIVGKEMMGSRYEALKKKGDNPVIMVGPKGELALTVEAKPIVHADGKTVDALHVFSPDNGYARKVPAHTMNAWRAIDSEVRGKVEAAEEKMDRAKSSTEHAKAMLERYKDNAYQKEYYENDLKDSEDEYELAKKAWKEARAEMRKIDPVEMAREEWQKQADAAPKTETETHHLIGGAVMRFWNPIRETTGHRLDVFSAVDAKSGDRVVGIEIPPSQINRLLARISGGSSTVDAGQIIDDVLKNGTGYELEGGIKIRRGRLAGTSIVQFVTSNEGVQKALKDLGVLYERGMQPTYYLPTSDYGAVTGKGEKILEDVLKQYPAKVADADEGKTPEGGGVTMSMLGTGSLDEAATKVLQPVVDYAKKAGRATFSEVLHGAGQAGKKAKAVGRELIAGLYPAALAKNSTLDVMGDALGEPALREFEAAQLLRGVDRMFSKMPETEWTDFIERVESSQPQPNEDLKQAAELFNSVLEAQREREQEAINLGRKGPEIELSNKEGYFPHRYSVLPGHDDPPTEDEFVASHAGYTRRPFEGSKAFMKQQTMTYREAIEQGAKPIGNPAKMIVRRIQEGAKFVGARWAWYNFKSMGAALFQKNGTPIPAGFEPIEDKSANVWRMIQSIEQTPTGENRTYPIQAGRWVMRQDAARILNNYLSKDFFRASDLGSTFIKAKNLTTEIRLGMSAFHWLYITAENMASGLQAGLDEFVNQGVRQLDPAKMASGVQKIGASPLAPYLNVKRGAEMLKYMRNADAFLSSKAGQDFVGRYPDFPRLINLAFRGGLRIQLADTFNRSFGSGFGDALKNGEMVKGIGKFLPWLAHAVAKPLFEHYIPMSKMAFAVEMLSQKLAQYDYAIEKGFKTEIEIAREVAEATDNRFGELNWDSLYLNNTMRTAMQFAFRSATWKLGSWRGAVKGAKETFSSDAFDDRIFEKMDQEAKDGGWYDKARQASSRIPQLGINAGWIMAMGLTVAITGSVFEKMTTGKFPWQWAKSATNGNSFMGNTALESMHPRTGDLDEHGEPIRLSFPTGLKDYEHGFENPTNYLKGSESDIVSNMWDTLSNQDAFGNYVYNPQDDTLEKFWQGLRYNAAGDLVPMSVANWKRTYGPQDFGSKLLRSTGSVGGAPRSLDRSHALTLALSLRRPHTAMTPEAQQDYEERQYLKETSPTPREERQMEKDKNLDYLQRVVLYQLSYPDAIKVYNDPKITPEEKAKLADIVERKQYNWERQQAKNERTVK